MCGIAGIVGCDRLGPDDGARAVAMRDVMSYRGPDGAGLHTDAHAALAHRRLSIVDLAGGHQPLSNETGDGLGHLQRRDLQPRATCARSSKRRGTCTARVPIRKRSFTPTSSGATTACSASAACSRSPSGMRGARRLLLVRDRLGVKPLYWARRGLTGCSSPPRSRRFSRAVSSRARPNHAVLSEVLATRYTAGTETLFEGIYKLLPGPSSDFRGRTRADRAVLGSAARRSGSGARPARRCRAHRPVSARSSRNRCGCG